MKQKIIEGAEALFIRYGVRSVSMDDVAREISVSKKTIYQHFTNKDELVAEATRYHLDANRERIERVIAGAESAIEELFLISRCMRENISRINPSLMYDLQKYHSDAWNVYNEFKNEFMKGKVKGNIIRGKSEGVYRKEIDEDILSLLRMEEVQMIFSERIFPKSDFDFINVQMEVYDHFIHGLLTDSGRSEFQQVQSKQKEKLNTK